jgi:hypothetical protein
LRSSPHLPPDGSQRLERLRGFAPASGRALPCVSAHRSPTTRPPSWWSRPSAPGTLKPTKTGAPRLLAGCDQPVAAFAPDGELIHATPAATPRLAGATSLAALGVAALTAGATGSDRAVGTTVHGPIAVDHIGSEAETVLLATFSLPVENDEPAAGDVYVAPDPAAVEAFSHVPPEPIAPDAATASEVPPDERAHIAPEPPASASAPAASLSLPEALAAPSERRHPLRFVWQMDEEGPLHAGLGRIRPPDRAADRRRARAVVATDRKRARPRSRGPRDASAGDPRCDDRATR